MNIMTVAQQMLILFAMMLLGFICFRREWIDDLLSNGLSWLVINLFNPFLIVNSVLGKSFRETGSLFWQNLILAAAFYLILSLVGLLLVRLLRPNATEAPVYRLMTFLPNCGFMGIPVVTGLLGAQYVIYVTVYMLIFNILVYTYGIHLIKRTAARQRLAANDEGSSAADIAVAPVSCASPASSAPSPGDGSAASHAAEPSPAQSPVYQTLRNIFANPGVIGCLAAMVLFFGGIKMPAPAASLISYLSSPSIPLSMMLIGCSLASSNLRAILRDRRLFVFLVLRMLVIPIAAALLIRMVPFDPTLRQLFVLMVTMPAGSLLVLITQEYGGNAACAANGVALTTLCSIVSIPVVSLFL